MKTNIIFFFLLISYSYSFAQMGDYDYKRDLHGVSDQWHKIVLPGEIFGKVNNKLSDIRIYGITENKDTIESPYLLEISREKIVSGDVSFKLINQVKNKGGFYFTFEIPTEKPINQIKLDFHQQNFDWRIKLEGSQDQQEWFSILENYRILSIKNKRTDYRFTKLVFTNSKYRFFRLFINSNENPGLETAKLRLHEAINGNSKKHSLSIQNVEEKQSRETEIDVKLELPIPLSSLQISIQDTIDYYRPVTIKYLTDSFKTEMGWKYNYRKLTSGILSSIEKNEFKFNSRILQNLKIIIHNYDNEPLIIESIEAKAYAHQLTARFSKPASYYLAYGNNKANNPHYDIDYFKDKIPDNLKVLSIGTEKTIEKNRPPITEPLFKNKIWLWAIMAFIILMLGWFSINMIQKK